MSDRREVHRRIVGKARARHADTLIAKLAAGQHDVFTPGQLLSRGVSHGAIESRLRSGHIEPVHRGVYKLSGPPLSQRGRWKAATLIHRNAVLSYRSAAALWQMRNSWNERCEVTIAGGRGQRPRLIIHRDALHPDEITEEDGIPVTTPARTLLDLASVLDAFSLERALHQSEYLRLTSPTSIPALLARHPRRRGSPALRRALESLHGGISITRSAFESEFLAFLTERGIPLPQTNVWLPVGDELIQVDCLWPAQRLIAELDTYGTHGASPSFERDRTRDRSLSVQGFHVIRITDRALHADPDAVERDIRALLAARSP